MAGISTITVGASATASSSANASHAPVAPLKFVRGKGAMGWKNRESRRHACACYDRTPDLQPRCGCGRRHNRPDSLLPGGVCCYV